MRVLRCWIGGSKFFSYSPRVQAGVMAVLILILVGM